MVTIYRNKINYEIVMFSSLCPEIRCPEIRRIPNLLYECTNKNAVGSECSFECGSGLKVNGATYMQCLKTGKWSDDLPRCVGKCFTCQVSDL